MRREEWQSFLKLWSEEWVVGHRPGRDRPLDGDVVRQGWLGFPPATDAQVAAAEERLGRSLPPSLREFLLVTDGWRNAGDFIHRLAGTSELAWPVDEDPTPVEPGDGLRKNEPHHAEAGDAEAGDADDAGVGRGPGDADVLRRSLPISLEGDSAALLLDPEDVDEHGEWAAYLLASWTGTGPERHSSFAEIMRAQYRSFHYLHQPPGETRDHWDAEVERARLAALAGEVDRPLGVFGEAAEYGRERALLLKFQLTYMCADFAGVPLSSLVGRTRDWLVGNPLFGEELLPLLLAEDRLSGTHGRPTVENLVAYGPERARTLVAAHEERRRDPRFRPSFGNPEFDAAVHRVIDRLTASDAAFDAPSLAAVTTGAHVGPRPPLRELLRAQRARRALGDAAWPELRACLPLWRPRTDDHIAPVVLFADPVLAELITPERGRELLSHPRG